MKCGSSSTLTVLLFRVSERPSTGVWSLRGKPGPGGLLAEKPSLPPTGQGSPCARVLGALLSGMPVGITVLAPRYLPASTPSDIFPTKGDVIIGPVTPLHAVLGHLPAASMPMVGSALYPRGRRGEAGGSGRALLIMQASGDPGPATQPPRSPDRDTQAGRTPAHWAVETLSSL